MTPEDMQAAGVVLLPQQIDFFHHPAGRHAVAVYGVPDPDRLYIAGPDYEGTIYQYANPGEPADERGVRACVLPLVFDGGDQQSLAEQLSYYEGVPDTDFPVVYGEPLAQDWAWRWMHDEHVVTVALWDLWPISVNDLHIWDSAAANAFEASKMPQIWELVEAYQGNEMYGDEVEEIRGQQHLVQAAMYKAEEHSPEWRKYKDELTALDAKEHEAIEAWFQRIEAEAMHPEHECIDPQIPPVTLPPEQSAIWHSLQAYSWHNWSLLAKQGSAGDGNALYGGRFVQANRRLCPWY